MKELTIGDKVKINSIGVIGTVTLVESLGIHVEHVGGDGNLIRRMFIIEELSAPDDEGNATGTGQAAGASSASTSTDSANSENPTLATSSASQHGADGAAVVASAKTADEMLVGSSVQPSTFTLADGTILQLGDIVRAAFEKEKEIHDGDFTVADWNTYPDEDREEAIQDYVDTLKLKTSDNDIASQNAEAAKADMTSEGGKEPADELQKEEA